MTEYLTIERQRLIRGILFGFYLGFAIGAGFVLTVWWLL